MREAITRGCAQEMHGWSFVKSPLKRLTFVEVPKEDYWSAVVPDEQAEAEVLAPVVQGLSKRAQERTMALDYMVTESLVPRLRFVSACRTEEERHTTPSMHLWPPRTLYLAASLAWTARCSALLAWARTGGRRGRPSRKLRCGRGQWVVPFQGSMLRPLRLRLPPKLLLPTQRQNLLRRHLLRRHLRLLEHHHCSHSSTAAQQVCHQNHVDLAPLL